MAWTEVPFRGRPCTRGKPHIHACYWIRALPTPGCFYMASYSHGPHLLVEVLVVVLGSDATAVLLLDRGLGPR